MSFGIGTATKNILRTLGVKITPHCSCQNWVDRMDANSAEWVQENKEKIIDTMQMQARRQKVRLFSRWAASKVIDLAIIASGMSGYEIPEDQVYVEAGIRRIKRRQKSPSGIELDSSVLQDVEELRQSLSSDEPQTHVPDTSDDDAPDELSEVDQDESVDP